MRGAMQFEDYNYDQVNQYILVQEPQDKQAAKAQRLKNKNAKGKQTAGDIISNDRIEKSISEAYDHESIKIPESKKEEDSEEEEDPKTKARRLRREKQQKAKNKKNKTSTQSKNEDDDSEDSGEESKKAVSEPPSEEDEETSEVEENVDDLMVHMYFKE